MSLPWYCLAEYLPAQRQFFEHFRAALAAAGVGGLPRRLAPPAQYKAHWADPDLLLSQACGLDLFTVAAAGLRPVARPVFADLDCAPGCYFSYIVGRGASLPAEPRVVVNSFTSHSGGAALLCWLQQQGLGAAGVVVSGSHRASLDCIAAGRADVAAIDAHIWTRLHPRRPARAVIELDRTPAAPAPPFVTAADGDVTDAALLAALQAGVKMTPQLDFSAVLPASRQTYRGMAARLAGALADLPGLQAAGLSAG